MAVSWGEILVKKGGQLIRTIDSVLDDVELSDKQYVAENTRRYLRDRGGDVEVENVEASWSEIFNADKNTFIVAIGNALARAGMRSVNEQRDIADKVMTQTISNHR